MGDVVLLRQAQHRVQGRIGANEAVIRVQREQADRRDIICVSQFDLHLPSTLAFFAHTLRNGECTKHT